MSDDRIPVELPDGGVIALRPGDAVVLIADRDLMVQQADRILERWREFLPDYPVVIVTGAEVAVLRKEDA